MLLNGSTAMEGGRSDTLLRLGPTRRRHWKSIDPYRLLNILYGLKPEIGEGEQQCPPHIIIHRVRNADAPRLCECLEPGGNVYAIPQEVMAANHYVAHMDSDAELKLRVGQTGCQPLLKF
jgi:hypothetical protein